MFDVYKAPAIDVEYGDDAAVNQYCEDLFNEFAESQEAARVIDEFGRIGWTQTFLGFIKSYGYSLPPEMSLDEVNQIVFGLFPEKVTTEPESAADIISELRAFFTFLGREFSLPSAEVIVSELSSDAVEELHDELSNPENFGLAKSFMMMGIDNGFDMTNSVEAAQFVALFNAGVYRDSSLDVEESEFNFSLTRFAPPPQAAVAQRKPLTAKERKKREQLRQRKLGISKRK